jgi:hypothetical protein
MIERKNKYIRIRVIGGAGIFDSTMNILKKPIVSKLLASAGKSAASALGERLVTRMIASAQPVILPPQPVALPLPDKLVHPAALAVGALQHTPKTTQPPSRRVQELISRYSARQPNSTGTGVTMRRQYAPPVRGSSQATGGAITIQEYVKRHKGTGIKLI